MYDSEPGNDVLVNLFKVLAKPDALEIFLLAGEGIERSVYAMEELGLTPKRYYARLRELVDMGFVRKTDGICRQTPFGSIFFSRLVPAMRRAYDARDKLGLMVEFRGTKIENALRDLIEDDIQIPSFTESINVKLLRDYEALAIEAVDLYDSAEKSVLLASNYFDVRVMEAVIRAVNRGITNTIIVGKKSLSSKVQNLRMMLSLTFMKSIVNFTSNKVELKDFVRVVDIPYTFCVVDGHLNIIDITNTIDETFIVALSVDDRDIGENLTDFYETLWKAGDSQSAFGILNSLKSG